MDKNKEELKEYIKSIINLNEEKYTSLCNDSCKKAKEWFNSDEYVDKIKNIVGKL